VLEFAEVCTPKLPSPPQRTNHTAGHRQQERPVKIESADKAQANNTQRLNRRPKQPLHKILEHIVPISLQSRIAEDRWTCVGSMVKDPNKRCVHPALGPNIDIEEICRSIEKSDLEADSTKFLELIAQLVKAVMCGRHRNSAMCPTRHKKLTEWVSNFSSLSDKIRHELQEWIDAIVHRTAPRDAQHSAQQPSLESTHIAGTRSQKTRNNIVAVPKTTKTGTAGIASTRAQLPWFKNYTSDSTRKFSIQEALHREAIKPLQCSVPKEGYIYVYWDKVSFGYVKIGYTNDLERRLNEWNKNCDHKHEYHPDVQRGELPQIAHVKRIERLIHIELRDHRKQRYCKKCKRNHIEWFQIGASSVMKVFSKWYEWIVQEPYAFDDKKRKWTVRPEMMDTLAQVCKPVAIDEKPPPPTPRRSPGAKKYRKSKGKAKNYRR
jgi:predicted GIY-YIG superfamily endonuclease